MHEEQLIHAVKIMARKMANDYRLHETQTLEMITATIREDIILQDYIIKKASARMEAMRETVQKACDIYATR